MGILKRNLHLCMDALIDRYRICVKSSHLLCPNMDISFVILIVILILPFRGKELQGLICGRNLVSIIHILWKYHFVGLLEVNYILKLLIF